MTANEARKQITECESKISSAYSGLKNNARRVGEGAASAAASAVRTKTLLPLILCVIGLICFAGPWFLGIILIAVGIILSVKLHQSAKDDKDTVARLQTGLNSTIDNNSNI